MEINQGDIFWFDAGEPRGSSPAYSRPVVVIQNNVFNLVQGRINNMKKCYAIILFTILTCVSCVNPENKTVNSAQNSVTNSNALQSTDSKNKEVILEIKIETDSTLKLKIIGETNLPEGTVLMISLTGKTTKYTGQDKTKVQSGKFESNEFSLGGKNLLAGQYEVDVTMPIPSTQSPSVRAVIGEKGENLKGSLVKQGDFGVTISVEKSFQLQADGKIILSLDKGKVAETGKRAKELFNKLITLEMQGRNMQSLRNTDDLTKVKECGNLMRERQKIADDLRSEAEKLPNPYSIPLSPAAIELKICVSCATSAIESCNRAKTSLEDAKKEIEIL